MEKVLGIGGFFFRAENPEELGRWYQTNLGIDLPAWQQQAGITAFAPFPKTTEDFGNLEKQWKINFRVPTLMQWPHSYAKMELRSRLTQNNIRLGASRN